MSTREDLARVANEYAALDAALDAQPQTTNPVTGQASSNPRLVGGALLYGMRGARAYVEDPVPFWLAGGALGLILVLLFIFALRGIAK